jgi:Protein of unknown function (DUF2924)
MPMALNMSREIAVLHKMSIHELRQKYAEVFGEQTRAHNRPWLVKRIAWRMQALAEGDLSERARRRAAELANDADLRVSAPRPRAQPPMPGQRGNLEAATLPLERNDRLPMPGTVITRSYKGRTLHVKVLAEGFEFEGELYKSLSAVAKRVTGTHWNGYHFFGLTTKKETCA